MISAGDDISDSTRVRRIVEAWLEDGKQPGSLHSAYESMDDEGHVTGRHSPPCLEGLRSLDAAIEHNPFVIGATGAWSRDLFEQCGPLLPNVVHEDRVIPFRSLLLGRSVKYLDEPLVKYRQGVGVSSFYKKKKHLGPEERRTILGRFVDDSEQGVRDATTCKRPDVADRLLQRKRRYEVALAFEYGMPSVKKWPAMARSAGLKHFFRMLVKRNVNQLLDRVSA